ncbi:MAG: hypothetical protein HY718_05185, partial [Planctomycetes bacterium]|nr:hypothetical protein [Planctomycetota bacterium]
ISAGRHILGDIVSGDDLGTGVSGAVSITAGVTDATGDIAGGTGDNETVDIRATGASPGDITADIVAANDIFLTFIDAGTGTGGSLLANVRAGTSGTGSIGTASTAVDGVWTGLGGVILTNTGDYSVVINADNHIGGSAGTSDIVADDNIQNVAIIGGVALAANDLGPDGIDGNTDDGVGDMRADILSGVAGAVVGGPADAEGAILNVAVVADGNVGLAATVLTIGAGDDDIGSAAEPVFILANGADTTMRTAGGTLVLDLAGGLAADGGLGDEAAQTAQNVLVNVDAGFNTANGDSGADIDTVFVAADGRVGTTTEGERFFRADGDVRDLTIDAGLGDDAGAGDGLDDGLDERILVDILAGLESDGLTAVIDPVALPTVDQGDIVRLAMASDDDIGDAATQAAGDGIKAADAITGFVIRAGGDSRTATSGTGGVGSDVDFGGGFFMNIVAGDVTDTSSAPAVSTGALSGEAGAFAVNTILADESVGGDSGAAENDIVASGSISSLTIVSGFAGDLAVAPTTQGLAGNIQVDILAGVRNATTANTPSSGGTSQPVGLVLSQTTGDPTTGAFDGSGAISSVTLRADGRIGTTDGDMNIAAADGISALTLVAEGAAVTTLGGNLFTSLSDDAASTTQSIYLDISAGAGSDDDDIANGISNLDMLADGAIGAGTGAPGVVGTAATTNEGFNYIRADGDIATVRIVAGNNDAGDAEEDFLMNIFAGLEADATGVSATDVGAGNVITAAIGFSDITDVVVLAEDDIGASDAGGEAEDTDGFFAAGRVTDLKLAAGTQAILTLGTIPGGFGGAAAFASSGGTLDEGGRVLSSVLAGVGYLSTTNVAVIAAGGGDADIDPTDIFSDNDVGESPRGTNTFRAASDIMDLRVFAGLQTDTTATDGAVFTDVISGYTNNLGPSNATLVRSYLAVLAGANGIAESTAAGGTTDVQVNAVGTSGLAATDVVINAGPEGILESAVATTDTVFLTSGSIDGLIVSADGNVESNIISADDIADDDDSTGTFIAAGQELSIPGRSDTGFNQGDGGSVLGDIIAGADGTGVLGDGSQLATGQLDVTIAADQNIGDLTERDIIAALGVRDVFTDAPDSFVQFSSLTDLPSSQATGGNGIDGIIVAGLAPQAFGDGNLFAPIDVDGNIGDHGATFSVGQP